jgi:hypothetical protein
MELHLVIGVENTLCKSVELIMSTTITHLLKIFYSRLTRELHLVRGLENTLCKSVELIMSTTITLFLKSLKKKFILM